MTKLVIFDLDGTLLNTVEDLGNATNYALKTLGYPQREIEEYKILCGRGIANLCLGVREKGSLNAAAKSMKMAYSKAWRIIKETEAALGIQLLDRDGAHGSTLTAEGDKLLDAYLEVDEKLQKIAEEEFAKRFS